MPPTPVLPRTDVHQHLWPEGVLGALARRSEPPFARDEGETWALSLAGEPPSTVAVTDAQERAAGLPAQGVDRAVVSLSTALRVERLAARDAAPLLEAWRDAARDLPGALRAWGSLNLAHATAADVDALLDEGFAGLCLPAAELAHPRRVEALMDVLGRLEEREAPLFVHPGPATGDEGDAPVWWPALTSYTATLQAAWWAWAGAGGARHPRLRVVFAALAGLAPLHHERAAARGGPPTPTAPQLFYDTSSYGPQAVALMRRAVGPEQLVYGSDAPVVAAQAPRDDALLRANPARLLR
ncbi:MAG: 6-methylsalicylate decarboxylase [Solirubrobacteraceae bacterium]|jgi:predicted TIM-barrel fold metal-dependent hydrolase|nr:6-methylsalicylate decarboxylase [Solirubrobacteraceae bacterium]